ncbi:MAG: ROK family protein [bacterium]|nr:ROK family protein [bacterium]MDZ4299443.1 ROK family protein [Candidatus Sungbacteria bacterium]
MPKQKFALAVDLGATNIRVAVVNADGKILAHERAATPHEGKSSRVVVDRIIEMAKRVLEKNKTYGKIAGVGIASCGPLDYKKGGANPANLPFDFIPLIEPLKQAFHVPTVLHNDANAAALGEWRFGVGRGKQNIVYVTLSTGIGAGVIVDGHVLFGATGNAAEVGHMTVDTTYNFPCGCGRGVGHWEGYCSGKNMPKFFEHWKKRENKKIDFSARTTKHIFAAAKQKNPVALEFLDVIHRMNARAISNILVAYDPELITIGGSVAHHNGAVILAGIKKYTEHYLKVPPLHITKLGEDIALLGATAAILK